MNAMVLNSSFFFFSSRGRHTRFSRDWSSDVCSSDLRGGACRQMGPAPGHHGRAHRGPRSQGDAPGARPDPAGPRSRSARNPDQPRHASRLRARGPDPDHEARPSSRRGDAAHTHDAGGGGDHDRRHPERSRPDAGQRRALGGHVTVKWGLLSTARINRRVLRGAAETDRAEVVAVASRDARRAETYAREHAIPKAYGSYEALLEDPDVGAVYISLPNALHVDWTLGALDAGKHVLCEK